jgi:hypothetical protein
MKIAPQVRLTRFKAAVAALACATTLHSSPALAEDIDFSLAPFVWASSMKGQLSEGPVTIPLDASAGDLAGGIKAGGMLHGEASSRRLNASIQVIYADFHDRSFAPVFGADVRNKLLTVEALAGPRLHAGGVEIVPMAGIRHTRISGAFNAPGLGALRAGKAWSEGLVGLEARVPLSDRLTLRARGTAALVGPGGQQSADFIAAASYRIGNSLSLAAGYRWAEEKVLPDTASSFGMNLKAKGPVLGLVIGL